MFESEVGNRGIIYMKTELPEFSSRPFGPIDFIRDFFRAFKTGGVPDFKADSSIGARPHTAPDFDSPRVDTEFFDDNDSGGRNFEREQGNFDLGENDSGLGGFEGDFPGSEGDGGGGD